MRVVVEETLERPKIRLLGHFRWAPRRARAKDWGKPQHRKRFRDCEHRLHCTAVIGDGYECSVLDNNDC